MEYKNAVKLLTGKSRFQIMPGLERINKLLKLIGSPQDKLKIIHAAGTNGKGSVCALISNILKCSGYKTGLYTSPHLIEYTERIRINGIQISKSSFAGLIEYVCSEAGRNGIFLTEFELLTSAAFKYFADNNTDFAVIETGLGGRLDASNAAEKTFLSIITSISKDHTDRLGSSIEQIAFEKAGIIKENTPVIISRSNKGFHVIKEQAEKKGAPLIETVRDAEITFENGVNSILVSGRKYNFPLLGLYQKQNAALALAAADYLAENGFKINLEEGLKTAQWQARLQYIKDKNLIIDGAHNPDAALELKKSLDYYFGAEKRIFIYGTLNTKDYKASAEILFRSEDEIYYYEFHHKNAVSIKEFMNNLSFLKNIKPYTDDVLNCRELKIVTGSLYMAGSFMKTHKELFNLC